MNKTNIPDPDLDNVLKRTLKDDLPPEAEARMNCQFLRLKSSPGQRGSLAEAEEWPWHGVFRKEVLAFASAILLILGAVMHLSGSQSALAHSIEQLKVIVTVTMSLNRAVSMDCTVLKPEAGGESASYHMLWRANGDARVDMVSAGSAQTIWISNETISFAGSDGGSIRSMPLQTIAPGPVWQPAMEFRTPRLLAKHMEEQYGLMQTGERNGSGSGEFLITGRENGQAVEITLDAKTYLPKVLNKYSLDSDRKNGDRIPLVEVQFHWNQPISDGLFVPGPLAAKQ
jgi:hypothetical protein